MKLSWFLGLPGILWLVYFTYLFLSLLITKIFVNYFNKKSPPTTGVLKRQFKDTTHPDFIKIHYYHMRGAIIKYTLWLLQKCPFPSLAHFFLRHVTHNKIGHNVIYENCFVGLEFTDIGNDCVIEVGSAISAHVVESLYGNLVLDEIKINDGAIVGYNTIIGPGVLIPSGFVVGDNSMSYKSWPLKERDGIKSEFFIGTPAKHEPIEMIFAEGDLKDSFKKLVK
ncbi:MAG: hypothetical protein ACTSVI_07370 [Promethearchaeota archaeon]